MLKREIALFPIGRVGRQGDVILAWLFEGLGTEIISLVVGLLLGTAGGWQLHKRQVRVSQKAGDYANQRIHIDGIVDERPNE